MEVADNAIEGTALTADFIELATEKITSGRAAVLVGADGVPPAASLPSRARVAAAHCKCLAIRKGRRNRHGATRADRGPGRLGPRASSPPYRHSLSAPPSVPRAAPSVPAFFPQLPSRVLLSPACSTWPMCIYCPHIPRNMWSVLPCSSSQLTMSSSPKPGLPRPAITLSLSLGGGGRGDWRLWGGRLEFGD